MKTKRNVNELADKRRDKIIEVEKKVNCDDLIYKYKGKSPDWKFDKYDNASYLINKIRNCEIKLADVKNDQEISKSRLGWIKTRTNRKKSNEQKNKIQNIESLQNSRNKAINFLMIIL